MVQKQNRWLLIVAFITYSLQAQIQQIETFGDFERDIIKHVSQNEVRVINFWATWCVPCVKELPYFNQIPKTIKGKKVKTQLVSLDLDDNTKRLEKYVAKKGIQKQVILLSDSNYDSWVNKINPQWSGALPATLILYRGKKYFFEKSYHNLDEILSQIKTIIQ